MKRKQLRPMTKSPAMKQKRNTPTLAGILIFRSTSYQGIELIHGHPGCADQCAKRSRRNFPMLRNGQARDMAGLDEDGMTSSLPIQTPTGAFKGAHGLQPGNHGQPGH